MAIILALFRMIGRSAGKILSAAFGWAVVALFGHVSPKKKLFLSALVGAAAVWPVLVLGVIFPGIATFLLAVVPIPRSVPHWPLRVLWIVLAALVPALLGFVLSRRSPRVERTGAWQTFLRGFPLTVGLSGAFLITLFVTPWMKLVWLSRRWQNESTPFTSTPDTYHQAASIIGRALQRHGVKLERTKAPGWMTASTRWLKMLGGNLFRQFVPQDPEYWKTESFFFTLYPNAVMFCGTAREVARAHGLVLEAIATSGALQTYDAQAQALERRLVKLYEDYRHNHSPRRQEHLTHRLESLSAELSRLLIPASEWDILYRRALQISRLVEGEQLLLDKVTDVDEHKPSAAPKVAEAASSALFAAFVGRALQARGGEEQDEPAAPPPAAPPSVH